MEDYLLPGKKDLPKLCPKMVFGGVYAFYARGTKAFAREPEEPAVPEEKEKWLSWKSGSNWGGSSQFPFQMAFPWLIFE